MPYTYLQRTRDMMKNSGEDTENGGGANGEPTEKQSKVEAD